MPSLVCRVEIFPTEQKLVIFPIQLYHRLVAEQNFLQQLWSFQKLWDQSNFSIKFEGWGWEYIGEFFCSIIVFKLIVCDSAFS